RPGSFSVVSGFSRTRRRKAISPEPGACSLSRLRWTQLDATHERAGIESKQVQHHFSDVVRRCLPIRSGLRGAAGESGRDGTGLDVADTDVVVAHFLHQRFAERIQ